MWRPRYGFLLVAVGLCLGLLAGCGSSGLSRDARSGSNYALLARYVAQIEPIRLAVNRLLDGADPILEAFREHRIRAPTSARRMGDLERQFAAYTVEVAAIAPANSALRSLHVEYAHTYILEDAYLSALVSGLAHHEFGNLPHTQSAQRAAIIDWRTGLTVLAWRARFGLPADLRQAGRGEIAPSPQAS